MDKKPKIETLQQPLLTSEGFINPAALNELGAAIRDLPKIHDRLRDDPEWNQPYFTFRHDIVGALAKWACRQSPYCCPDAIESVLKYLASALAREFPWDQYDMAKLSLNDISKALYSILYEQGVEAFDNWNKAKVGNQDDIQFCSATSLPDPDREFIDLDALIRNCCTDIRTERRANREFDLRVGIGTVE